jgi:hypothetical protein
VVKVTIKDILDTPISDMWNAINLFVIFFGFFFLLVLSFIGFVYIIIIKGHKEFEKRRKERFKGIW